MSGTQIWMDGAIGPAEDFTVPIAGDASLRGISIFEGIKAYRQLVSHEYCVVSFDLHLTRLERSASLMHLPMKKLARDVTTGVQELLSRESRPEVYLRPTVYLRSGYYGETIQAGMFILARAGNTDRTPAKCIISRFRHVSGDCYPAEAKVGAMYAFFRLARLEATESGAHEAILLTSDGCVAETPGASVFIVKNGVAYTPPLDAGILPSITRRSALQLLRDVIGLETREQSVTVQLLLGADEVFLTGTLDEIRPVSEIDGRTVGDGNTRVTRMLQERYLNSCRAGRENALAGSAWFTGTRS